MMKVDLYKFIIIIRTGKQRITKNCAVWAKDVSSLSDLQCMHETMMDLLDQESLLFHSEIHADGKRALR